MAVRIARFTTWRPDDIELPDGQVYACRQISAGGMDLLERVTSEPETVERSELVAEVMALLSASETAVKRCSVEELVAVLIAAAMPAEKLKESLASAEKNAAGGLPATSPQTTA